MTSFNFNQVNGKWIIGTNNTGTKSGLKDWSTLGSILNIPSVIDGNNIEEIGKHAFYSCKVIEEIIIGDGIKKINQWAFAHLLNLRRIVIPSSVEFIGNNGIHCYNETAQSIYGESAPETTGKGNIVVTFLPDSKISFIGSFGI